MFLCLLLFAGSIFNEYLPALPAGILQPVTANRAIITAQATRADGREIVGGGDDVGAGSTVFDRASVQR